MSMKVFSISESDCYLAGSLYEAVKAAMKDSGLPFDELCDDDLGEVTEENMQSLKFDPGDGNLRTFAEELKLQLAEDATRSRMFSSTEW